MHRAWGLLAALSGLVASAAFGQPANPAPAAPWIAVELNKVETVGNGCAGYFVLANGMRQPIKELRLEVYLFDKQGTIVASLAIPFADVRSASAKIGTFQLAQAPCGELGKLLINEVILCTDPAGAPIQGCAEAITATSRAGVQLTY